MKLPNFSIFKRTFVSLVISQNKLKVVKINQKNNSIIKFAQVDIPPGVIVNYRVKDKEALIKLIKNLWSKNKIRDKYVGVVVPEFSTYTKSLALPNLSDTELNEALSWRIQEFLPTNIEDVVLDWKIIKREKDKAHVLTVAILKDVLFEYIDAVGSADLSPLVVETPSLSIQRVLDNEDTNKLIIYVNGNETILVITGMREIVASSVVTTNDFNTVVNTARQMIAHYNHVNIEKIVVSGVGITQDLIQYLTYNLGRSVQFGDVKVKGLLPGQVQDYLIGISLQYKNPVEPASELTINLLPPSWAEHYKKQSSGIKAWTLTLISSIVVWSVFLFMLIVYMFFNIQIQELENSDTVAKTQELNEAVTQVKEINTLADDVLSLASSAVYPQEILNLVSSINGEGVRVDSYRINYDTGEIIMNGNSTTRANLLAFKNSLEEKEDLTDINLPISNLLQENDINFDVSMVYGPIKVEEKETKGPVKLKI